MNTPLARWTQTRLAASLAVLAMSAVLATTAGADNAVHPTTRGSRFDWSSDGRLIEVSVQVDGSTAPLYQKNGVWDRRYVQAFKGRNYALVLRNTTARRVGVLIAVDGLNVVNGERSRLAGTEPMYVLDPYESATIRGWRTSLNDIRRFVFVDEQRSYAERTGQANGDMGWIRVLAFNETQPVAIRDWDLRKALPYEREEAGRDDQGGARTREAPRAQAQPNAPSTDAVGEKRSAQGQLNAAPESAPGTGWGEQGFDPVQRTVFLAERNATDRITLRYEYASGLTALGIFPQPRQRTWDRERGQLGFAPPPRW